MQRPSEISLTQKRWKQQLRGESTYQFHFWILPEHIGIERLDHLQNHLQGHWALGHNLSVILSILLTGCLPLRFG